MNPRPTAFGIERIGLDPLTYRLDMRALARRRGRPESHVADDMLVEERSVPAPWEDAVTMCVNAARYILRPEDVARIGFLVTATESSVDEEKSLATWVHRHLGLPRRCRAVEVKSACYAGTWGLMAALHWLSGPTAPPDAKALVVMGDASRTHLGAPFEFALGGCGLALLVSASPDFVRIYPETAVPYLDERQDLIRPDPYVEVGDTELSVMTYLDALESCLDGWTSRSPRIDLLADVSWNVYHAPFGGMTFLAHRAVAARSGVHGRAAARESFEARVAPSLRHARRIGTMYSASTFLGIASVAGDERASAGQRLSVFAFGAGSAAELYLAELGAEMATALRLADLEGRIARRTPVSVETYEQVERHRTSLAGKPEADLRPALEAAGPVFAREAAGARLVLEGIEGYGRKYAWR